MYELLKSQTQIVQSNANNVGPQARYVEIHSTYYMTQVSYFDCTIKKNTKKENILEHKRKQGYLFL